LELYIIIFLDVAIVLGIVFTIVRFRLKHKSEWVESELSKIKPNIYTEEGKALAEQNDGFSTNIVFDIETSFPNHIIIAEEEQSFSKKYENVFNESSSLISKLNFFHVTPTERLIKFVEEFENIHDIVIKHNETVINKILSDNKEFFDKCLKYPLDEQQRRAIVSEENNCLVVSSAGSGKTSSIVGKVKYLTEIKRIEPSRILLISYTNKAAAELTERMNIANLRGYTFHKLAIDIIGKITGEKPSICENTDVVLVQIYKSMQEDPVFKKNVLSYFIDYQMQEEGWEKKKKEIRDNLSEQKNLRLKTLLPDMDGNTVFVKSEQEQRLCFVLSSLGVNFRYEEPYEYNLSDETHSQYKPDFSIHYVVDGKPQRLYLEHFGVDEHGLVPTWFAKDKNMSYEEANKKYNDGITWKKEAHAKYGTKLITTNSADFSFFDIREKMKELLTQAGVPIVERTNEELYSLIIPKDSKREKTFIRLIATFITLLKASCKSIDNITSTALAADDKRSAFIIKGIFEPVYVLYEKELKTRKQIDFTDAIIKATELCNSQHPLEYDYIIVDEFQDISLDRYEFLKALRGTNKPAKLFCVGDDWQSIYRFSGSDMSLFNHFQDFFGPTDIKKIETTYRFGEPLVSLSSNFILRNSAQIKKTIHPYSEDVKTNIFFKAYDKLSFCDDIERIIENVPNDKSIFLLGRYSFDDYYLSFKYKCEKIGNRFYYNICGRRIEFLTVHKSKGLEADYVILLQCNKDIFGFPSQMSDDPVLNYVLTENDNFPFSEERRLFYVAMTRAKISTIVLYDKRFPSVFVDEFLHPEKITEKSYAKHPNAQKKWTRGEEAYLIKLHNSGRSVKYISQKMGRSQTSIIMRLGKLGVN